MLTPMNLVSCGLWTILILFFVFMFGIIIYQLTWRIIKTSLLTRELLGDYLAFESQQMKARQQNKKD